MRCLRRQGLTTTRVGVLVARYLDLESAPFRSVSAFTRALDKAPARELWDLLAGCVRGLASWTSGWSPRQGQWIFWRAAYAKAAGTGRSSGGGDAIVELQRRSPRSRTRSAPRDRSVPAASVPVRGQHDRRGRSPTLPLPLLCPVHSPNMTRILSTLSTSSSQSRRTHVSFSRELTRIEKESVARSMAPPMAFFSCCPVHLDSDSTQ